MAEREKRRIVWIDAFKAFLALSVIFNHTQLLMETSEMPGWLLTLHSVLHAINVPGFAFISGYIAYKPVPAGVRVGELSSKLWVRMRAYLVPAVVFLIIMQGSAGLGALMSWQLGPYYFLGALANIFVVYYLLRMLLRGMSESRFLISLGGVMLLASVLLYIMHDSEIHNFMHWRETCDLMLFFTVGVFVKSGRRRIRWLVKPAVVVMLILVFVSGIYANEILIETLHIPRGVMRIMISLMGVISAGGVFYILREALEGERMRVIAGYGGRRTLSMYAIHPVVLLIALNMGIVVDTVTLVPMCVVTALLCWCIHDVVYKLPALHLLLFGQRRVV